MQYFENPEQAFFVSATLLKAIFIKKDNQNDIAAEYAKVVLNLENASLIAKEQARAILSNLLIK